LHPVRLLALDLLVKNVGIEPLRDRASNYLCEEVRRERF